MSDTYPAGYYPANPTTPPVWGTPAATGSVVQHNGLVYQKNDRHTGGTGSPDEEVDDDGFRTWSLYVGNASGYDGFRFNVVFLCNQMGRTINFDEDVYSSTEFYFFDGGYSSTTASFTVETDYPIAPAAAILPLVKSEFLTRDANTPFNVYEPEHNPGIRTVTAGDGYNGYWSDPPGAPPRTPPTLAPIEINYDEVISFNHSWFVGRTYTGYLEVLTSTGFWQANGFGSYDYVVNPATVTQIGITVEAKQSDYEAYLAATAPSTNPVTHSIIGGVDTWVQFGSFVLTSVTPDATN
jgi:hypothetical protein